MNTSNKHSFGNIGLNNINNEQQFIFHWSKFAISLTFLEENNRIFMKYMKKKLIHNSEVFSSVITGQTCFIV